jgi:excisionase family DNA binding protein
MDEPRDLEPPAGLLALAPFLVDVPTAARLLACSRGFLYELIAAGEIPTVKLGRARRIPVDELRRYVAEHSHRFVRAA